MASHSLAMLGKSWHVMKRQCKHGWPLQGITIKTSRSKHAWQAMVTQPGISQQGNTGQAMAEQT